MIDSSSASARDRSSVVIVDGVAFSERTRSSISSMSARRTRFALRSLACSGVEMTSSPLTVAYLSRKIEVPSGAQQYTPVLLGSETLQQPRRRLRLTGIAGPA